MVKITKTQYFPNLISKDIADSAFEYLKNNIGWYDDIYSYRQSKVSRKAYHADLYGEMNEIDEFIRDLVFTTLKQTQTGEYNVLGSYVNYYLNGTDFAPSHNHPKQVQLVISLGATRKLIVGKKEYDMSSGDVIIFGNSQHEVLMEPEITKGRISIATFMFRDE